MLHQEGNLNVLKKQILENQMKLCDFMLLLYDINEPGCIYNTEQHSFGFWDCEIESRSVYW